MSFMVLSPCEHSRLIFSSSFFLLLRALRFKKLKMTNTTSFIMPSHTVSQSHLPASICTQQGHETNLVPVFQTVSEVSYPPEETVLRNCPPCLQRPPTHPSCHPTSTPGTEVVCCLCLKGSPLFNCLSDLTSFFSCARG